MATLQLIQAIQAGLVNPTTGAALASGKCRFYDVSTLTPQTVYSDSAGATPITQPLTLTAGGTGTVYTASACRCIVKDALDSSTIYDVAVINGAAPATTFVTSSSFNAGNQTTLQTILDAVDDSFGGTDWKYKIGTTSRNLQSVISEIQLTPQDYGATGDGATDDTAAFAAMAIAQAATGRPIFIPRGTYQLSATTTFTGTGVIIRGSNASTAFSSLATVLRGTNGTMGLFSFTASDATPTVENLFITHATSTTGTAIDLSTTTSTAILRNVRIAAGKYAAAISSPTVGISHAFDCDIAGSTSSTTGNWILDNCSVVGTASALTKRTVASLGTSAFMYVNTTTDMANGGNTTPAIGSTGQLIAFQRIRGTSAGSGTVNATSVPTDTKILICDFFNNSGGAFTFTLNAQYHGTGNPAPANGTRRLVAYVWEPTSSVWEEFARSASDVT